MANIVPIAWGQAMIEIIKLQKYKRPFLNEIGYKYKHWYIVRTFYLKTKSNKWTLEKYGEPCQFFKTLNDVKKHLYNLDKL